MADEENEHGRSRDKKKKKQEEEERKVNDEEERRRRSSRFMRNGDSVRAESPLICASVHAAERGKEGERERERENAREEGEEGDKRCIRGWYRRQMHQHSVLLHPVQLSAALQQPTR